MDEAKLAALAKAAANVRRAEMRLTNAQALYNSAKDEVSRLRDELFAEAEAQIEAAIDAEVTADPELSRVDIGRTVRA